VDFTFWRRAKAGSRIDRVSEVVCDTGTKLWYEIPLTRGANDWRQTLAGGLSGESVGDVEDRTVNLKREGQHIATPKPERRTPRPKSAPRDVGPKGTTANLPKDHSTRGVLRYFRIPKLFHLLPLC
jgi:hypothetical protein